MAAEDSSIHVRQISFRTVVDLSPVFPFPFLIAVTGFIFILLFSGCAGPPPGGPAIPAPERSRFIPSVPYYPDEDNQCGPASLAAVLNFHGAGVTLDEVSRAVYRENLGGALGLDLTLFARSKGFKARWSTGRFQALLEKLDTGRPLLVMVDYGWGGVSRNHFIVVAGYGPAGVKLNSGKILGWYRFHKLWGKTRFWNLVIEKPDE